MSDTKYQTLPFEPTSEPSINEQNDKLQEMKTKIIDSEVLNKFPFNDHQLMVWLNISNWDVEFAIKRFYNNGKFRRSRPHWFYNYPLQQYDELLRREHCCILDGRDKFGRKVYYMESCKMDPAVTKLDEQSLLDSLWLESILYDDPDTLKKGICVVLDAKGATWKLIKWYPPRNISGVTTYAETSPTRNLEVNVINTSKGFNVMIKTIFPLLGSFIRDRFRFHYNDHESLAKRLGKEILPPHLGGTGPKIDMDKAIKELYTRYEDLKVRGIKE